MEQLVTDFTGHVILVMAPTGSGKGTLINQVLKTYPDLYETVSCTSRSMRPGEVHGKEYYFCTKEEFATRVENGDFLEWAEFAGNHYGTLKSEVIPRVQECNVVLLEIELQGVEQLVQLLPRTHITIVYIEAGGWEKLKKRALARAPMSDEELEKRYERFQHETASKPLADVVINNEDDIEVAHAELAEVIESVYKKCKV
jgi:guanylate kinase